MCLLPINPMPLLAEFRAVDLIPAAGMLLLITGMMIIYRRRRRNQSQEVCLTPQEQLDRNRQLRGVQGDIERLMVELEQFSKRLAAQLDAKTIAIELLLKQADQRITELKRLDGHSGGAQAGAEPSSTSQASELRPRGSTPSAPATAAAELPSDPVSRSVYQLADQGLAPEAIAKRLNEHVGKIELILALRTA